MRREKKASKKKLEHTGQNKRKTNTFPVFIDNF